MEDVDEDQHGSDINELRGIKVGDIIVFNINDMEFKASVSSITNEKYVVNGNFSDDVKKVNVEFDQIIEHYPRNNGFNKTNEEEDKLYGDLNDVKGNNNRYVVFFKDDMRNSDIEKSMNNQYKEAKYFVVDKNKETHIVRFKEDGFKMKPFVESVIDYLLKKRMISEDISTMKLVGNDGFCIIKNPKPKTVRLIKNILKDTLK